MWNVNVPLESVVSPLKSMSPTRLSAELAPPRCL